MLKLGQGIRDVETFFLFIDFLQLFGAQSCVTQGFWTLCLMLSKKKFFNVSVFNLIKLLSIPSDIHILAVCTKFVIRPSLPRVERTSEVLIRRPYWGSTPIASTLSSFSSGIPVSFTENIIFWKTSMIPFYIPYLHRWFRNITIDRHP